MKILYRDRWVTIEERHATVRGKKVEFQRWVERNVVTVLPILEDGRILMERQFRHAIGRYLYEIPAGLVEKGESTISAARRELGEETGYVAKEMKFMFKIYQSPAVGSRTFYHFYAKKLRPGKRKLDNSEIITLMKVKPSKLESMIKSNQIMDHKTVESYLYYKTFIAK